MMLAPRSANRRLPWVLVLCLWWHTVLTSARIEKHPKLVTMDDSTQRVEGSYLISFKEGATMAQDAFFASDYVKHSYKYVLPGYYALETVPDGVLNRLLETPTVREVFETGRTHVDPIVEKQPEEITQTDATWGIDRIDQRDLPLDGNYNYDFTGDAVTIFILDEGVLPTHEEFAGRYLDCTDFTGEGCEFPGSHGTHVAGTAMGATYGVAKGAMVYDMKVLNALTGSGSFDDFIAGLDNIAARKMANPDDKYVANASLGGSFFAPVNEAVANLVATGVVMVVSAGNDSYDACNNSPASAAEAVTVASTTMTDIRSSFSNFGSCVDIFAPGSFITSAWNTGDTDTAVLSGTSMASPHVAGIAALLLEEGLDPYEQLFNDATTDAIEDVQGSPNFFAFNGYNEDPILTAHPTPVPTAFECSSDEVVFRLDLLTDDFGSETTWELSNDCSENVVVAEGGPYQSNIEIVERACVTANQKYTFTIYDSFGDGICCSFGMGSYDVYVDDILIGSGGEFAFEESTSFGSVCPPTPAPTPAPTVACAPGESAFLLELLTDNYGGETTWSLIDECKDDTILSGGPYENNELIRVEQCISDASYNFTILDSYGDGICCFEGEGSYAIYYDYELIQRGGEFEFKESTSFGECLVPTLSPTTAAPVPPTPAPTPGSTDPLDPTPLVFGDSIPNFSALAGEVYFFIYSTVGMTVLPDDQVTCTLKGPTGDASLGVRLEQFGDFDCVSNIEGSSNEECIIIAPSGTVSNAYVQVAAGSQGFSDLTLLCEFGTVPTIPPPTIKPTLPYIPAPGSF